MSIGMNESGKNGNIVIVFKDDEVFHYRPVDYTEYKYDGKYFIVIKDNQWIGMYNLDVIACIRIEY